jgi:hypothetical protein
MTTPIASNLSVYLDIAREALASSKAIAAAQTRPMPDGRPGSIMTWDPRHDSFRQSVIAIVFAGIYFDAFLYIAIRQQRQARGAGKRVTKGRKRPRKRGSSYEASLEKLNVTDAESLAACKRFSAARNALVHEKALIGPDYAGEIYVAQVEADHALSLVERIARLLPG